MVRFTTDIPYLSQWGTPLLIGPGSILNAHTEHESVGKQELAEAVELYARLTRASAVAQSTIDREQRRSGEMKLALIGHGAMGQLVENLARAAGDEIRCNDHFARSLTECR